MITSLLFWSAILILSLAVLIKASDHFTGAAEKIGLMAGISPFVVGVTIVSIGTSLPELISSLLAVYENASEIVAGNVIGSNIANIFLILAAGAIMAKKLEIKRNLISVDLPLLVASAVFTVITTMDGEFSRGEAVLSVLCLAVFFAYLVSSGRVPATAGEPGSKMETRPFVVVLVSAIFIFLGAKFTIDAVVEISEILDLGKELVAVSAVALGTSLPELAVTYSAVKKGNPEIVIGNVLGSNIFNTYAVLGIPGLFGALAVPVTLVKVGLPVLIGATVLFLVVTVDRKVTQWEGWVFLLLYAFFIGKIFDLI
ncbi:MAG TPA: calcium/sodium antiporter [Calditrichia bacterium]|nr:calcium/sodium antiporter [Calditrichia bacterium]